MEMTHSAMQTVVSYVIVALAISVVLNILLKRIGVSQVIGYIATGTIIAYALALSPPPAGSPPRDPTPIDSS